MIFNIVFAIWVFSAVISLVVGLVSGVANDVLKKSMLAITIMAIISKLA